MIISSQQFHIQINLFWILLNQPKLGSWFTHFNDWFVHVQQSEFRFSKRNCLHFWLIRYQRGFRLVPRRWRMYLGSIKQLKFVLIYQDLEIDPSMFTNFCFDINWPNCMDHFSGHRQIKLRRNVRINLEDHLHIWEIIRAQELNPMECLWFWRWKIINLFELFVSCFLNS